MYFYMFEENGYVESFYKILGSFLKGVYFYMFKDLENWLNKFYQIYNNYCQYSFIVMFSLSMFWVFWEDGKIEMEIFDKKKVWFKLRLSFQDVLFWKEIYCYDCFFG